MKDPGFRGFVRNYVADDLLPHRFILTCWRKAKVSFGEVREFVNLAFYVAHRGFVTFTLARDLEA